MKDTLVSIIIPFKDRQASFEECLASLKRQTHSSLEVVCVNDASSAFDETLIRRFEKEFKRLVYLTNEQTLGPGPSRQKGFEASRGKYVLYMDSDDVFHPEMVSRCLDFMEKNPGLGMCYVTTREFRSARDLEHPESLPIRKRSGQTIVSGIISEILTGRRIWDTSSCFWRRSSIEIFEPWLSFRYEDYAYEAQIDSQGILVGHVPETLCYYRNHPEGIGKNFSSATYPQKMGMLLYVANYIARSKRMSGAKKRKLMHGLILPRVLKLQLRYGKPKQYRPPIIESILLRAVVDWPFLSSPLVQKLLLKILPQDKAPRQPA